MWLKLRLYLIMAVLFSIVYGLVVFAASYLGLQGTGFFFYGVLAT